MGATLAMTVGAIGVFASVVGLAVAMRAGNTYVSGLLVGPGTAALFCLALGAQVRQLQRRRRE